MPILRNTAQAISVSVRVSGSTDAPYVAATWPNDNTARMWYSKGPGTTPIAIVPARIDATTGRWLLSTATLTASVWDCTELTIWWEGTAITFGERSFYPEELYTSTVAGRIDENISAPKALTAGERSTLYSGIWGNGTRSLTTFGTLTTDIATAVWANSTRTLSTFGTLVSDIATAVWASGTRTLTAIADSSGVSTLLSRIASAITITSGRVDVNDKTGFSLSTAPATVAAIRADIERTGGMLALTKESVESVESQTANTNA